MCWCNLRMPNFASVYIKRNRSSRWRATIGPSSLQHRSLTIYSLKQQFRIGKRINRKLRWMFSARCMKPRWSRSRPQSKLSGRKVRVGDEVWSGSQIVTLPSTSQLQVFTHVNEVDVERIAVGQDAVVRFVALPGVEVRGRVQRLATLGRQREEGSSVIVFDRGFDGAR